MTSPQIRVRIPARVLLLILPILLVDSCQRTGRHLLMPGAQERSAQEIITSFKNDFDLNVYFGLRKIGISRETGKLSDLTVLYSAVYSNFKFWDVKLDRKFFIILLILFNMTLSHEGWMIKLHPGVTQ